MHALLTIETAREIANRFGLQLTDEAMQKDIDYLNNIANQPMTPAKPCSEQFGKDYANSYRTGLRDPAENLAYWYVQQADEIEMDCKSAAYDEARIY